MAQPRRERSKRRHSTAQCLLVCLAWPQGFGGRKFSCEGVELFHGRAPPPPPPGSVRRGGMVAHHVHHSLCDDACDARAAELLPVRSRRWPSLPDLCTRPEPRTAGTCGARAIGSPWCPRVACGSGRPEQTPRSTLAGRVPMAEPAERMMDWVVHRWCAARGTRRRAATNPPACGYSSPVYGRGSVTWLVLKSASYVQSRRSGSVPSASLDPLK